MTLKKFSFNVLKKEKFARLGKIITSRGTIDTPVFMPVGTQATVKGTFIKDVLRGRFTAGVLSAGLIDRLGNSRLVLVELLEGPLEVGVGIGGAGHEASGGVNPQDVMGYW